MVTALNCDDAPAAMEFGVPADGSVTDLLGCSENVRFENGRLCVTLPANTGTVLYIGQVKAEEPEDTAWNKQPVAEVKASEAPQIAEDPVAATVSSEEKNPSVEDTQSAPDMGATEISEQEISQDPAETAVDGTETQPETEGQTASDESGKLDSAKPRITGIILMTEDMGRMIDFYRNALGFSMEMQGSRAYFEKDGIVLTMVGRRDYERLTARGYGYCGGVTNHFHLLIAVDDGNEMHQKCLGCGAQQLTAPGHNEWGEYTSCVADPDGNIIELTKENDRG